MSQLCLPLLLEAPRTRVEPSPRWSRMGHRRQRPVHPHAAAHALALAHLALADNIAGNIALRTTHSFDELRQLAMIGLIKEAGRFDGSGGRSFRPYARTYANGEITHYLRDHGFAIKVAAMMVHCFISMPRSLR